MGKQKLMYFSHPRSGPRLRILLALWVLSFVFLLNPVWLSYIGSVILALVAFVSLLWVTLPNLPLSPYPAAGILVFVSMVGAILYVWTFVPASVDKVPVLAFSILFVCNGLSECMQRS